MKLALILALYGACAFVMGWMGVSVGSWIAFGRRVPDAAHWTERARATWTGARWTGSGCLIVPILVAALLATSLMELGELDRWMVWTLLWPTAMAGALHAGARWQSRHRRPCRISDVLRDLFIAFVFFAPAALAAMMAMLVNWSGELDARAVATMAASLSLALALSFGGSIYVARWIGMIDPPDERLKRAADHVANLTGTKPRRLGLLNWRAANALAFPINGTVLATRTLMDILTDAELHTILAHEYAHLRESRYVTLGRVLGGLVYMPLLWWIPLAKALGRPGLLIALGICVIGSRLVRSLSVRMEKQADAAATGQQAEAGAYALALEKIYEWNLIPAKLGSKNSITHPHLYNRLIEAGAPPSYPPPMPPPRYRFFLALLAGSAVVGVMSGVFHAAIARWPPPVHDKPHFETIRNEQ